MKPGPTWSRTLVIMSGVALCALAFSLAALNSCSTVVNPDPRTDVANVDVVPASDTLDVGGTFHLSATPVDQGGHPLDRPVAWSSNNTTVVSVDATGWIAAH